MIALTILIGILTFIAYSILYMYSNVKKVEGALANYNDMFTRQEKVNTAFNSINMAIIDQVKANNEFISYMKMNDQLYELEAELNDAEDAEEFEKCNILITRIAVIESEMEHLRKKVLNDNMG